MSPPLHRRSKLTTVRSVSWWQGAVQLPQRKRKRTVFPILRGQGTVGGLLWASSSPQFSQPLLPSSNKYSVQTNSGAPAGSSLTLRPISHPDNNSRDGEREGEQAEPSPARPPLPLQEGDGASGQSRATSTTTEPPAVRTGPPKTGTWTLESLHSTGSWGKLAQAGILGRTRSSSGRAWGSLGRRHPEKHPLAGCLASRPGPLQGGVLAKSLQPRMHGCFPKVLEVLLPPIEPGFPFPDSLV